MKNSEYMKTKDSEYMRMALELARKGDGWVNPNPMVGAVIVKDDAVIGAGYHEKYGGLHAERNALAACTADPGGATLYVTLEPCCHYGKTPPCTEAVIESGISRVVIGTLDPNPAVSGKSIRILQNHGIQADVGILEEDCRELIKRFSKFITTGRPYVTMKYAMTLDGKIAAYTGLSRWITGEAARVHVHENRHNYTAVMVGVNTVICDDPLLTCRLEHMKNPIRIICDTNLRTPLTAGIVETAYEVGTIIATGETDKEKHRPYQDKNCKIVAVEKKDNHVNLEKLMEILGSMGIDSIISEGGGLLNWSALQAHIVDQVQAYIAPKILGGMQAKSPVGGQGIRTPAEAVTLEETRLIQLEADYLIEGEVVYPCLQGL